MNRKWENMFSKKATGDEGFAMALVISVVLIMFIMLAAMMLPLSLDVSSALRVRSIVTERQLAESVMNELFSQAAKSSDLTQSFRMIGRVDPGLTASVDLAGPLRGWAEYEQPTGTFQTCSAIQNPCFYYSPQIVVGSPFVNVEVTTRTSCIAPTGTNCVFRRFQQSWRRRTFVDYAVFTDMETLEPRLYGGPPNPKVAGDLGLQVPQRAGVVGPVYMSETAAKAQCADARPSGAFTVRNGLNDTSRRQTSPAGNSLAQSGYYLWPHRVNNDPAQPIDELVPATQPAERRGENCFEIAYTGGASGDLVKGPIHTNDYWFWTCGSPIFTSTVEAGGDPSMSGSSAAAAIFHPTTNSGCAAAASAIPTSDGLSAAVSASRGQFLKLPDKLDSYDRLATVKLVPTTGKTVKITMTGKTMSVDLGSGTATTMPIPYRGVVYIPAPALPAVANDLEISGQASDVTFVTDGNLTVTGDITQPAGTSGVTLGFVAKGSTTIMQNAPVSATVPGADRTIYGAFLSLTGGMLVDGWNDTTANSLLTHPTLKLYGAVIAKFRPVFGQYDVNGVLKSGMQKYIEYPSDLAGNPIPPTPPYFLEPVNAVWVRLDLSETPIKTGSPGLTLQPASPPPTIASGACPNTWPLASELAIGMTPYVPGCLIIVKP